VHDVPEDEKQTENMSVKFNPAFRTFLREEANKWQGAASEDSICGFLTYGEWFKIWAKACVEFPDCSLDEGGEADMEFAKLVR